ncbi:MAG: hypothetical protein WC586_00500 [Methanoregula sp.]
MKIGETQNELRVCFIAYADILGYSERIQNCKNDYGLLKTELDVFKSKILEHQTLLTESIESLQGTVSFFSDSVYVHVPIASRTPKSFDDGRVHICIPIQNLGRYQFDLAIQDIFIRGGATINYGYVDDSIAFGPGLIHAVECEKSAEYPRICLTDDWAMKPIRHYIDNGWPGDERINKFVLRSEDGKFFINYLYTVVDNIEDNCEMIPDEMKEYPLYLNVPEEIDSLKKHKENIELNLKGLKDTSIVSKFVWLANYHNYFCKKHFKDLEYLIITGYQGKFYPISSE